jgi:uncharacterized protein
VKFLRNYNIDIIKLKDGPHQVSFNVNDEFIKFYEAEDWAKGADLKVVISLSKTVSVIEADFNISGTIRLICDRSLEEFHQPLDFQDKVIYKYGPMEQEISEDVFMITRDAPYINVAQLIYEFILISIPAKKIHPDYLEEMDDEDFDQEGSLVYLSDDMTHQEPNGDSTENNGPVDPRWEILNKLKKKE